MKFFYLQIIIYAFRFRNTVTNRRLYDQCEHTDDVYFCYLHIMKLYHCTVIINSPVKQFIIQTLNLIEHLSGEIEITNLQLVL